MSIYRLRRGKIIGADRATFLKPVADARIFRIGAPIRSASLCGKIGPPAAWAAIERLTCGICSTDVTAFQRSLLYALW
jgi:hypothetical protein